MHKIRILFLIHRFIQGGAEQQLFELVKGIDKRKFDVTVGSLVPGGAKWEEFQTLPNVRVLCFDRKHKMNFFVLIKLLNFLTQYPVDIIHTYLAPATVFGTLAGLISRTPALIIAERGTESSFSTLGSKIYFLLENFLVRYIDLIIANSTAGKNWRIKLGVDEDKIVVINNGIDPRRLQIQGLYSKQALGIDDGSIVLGSVARLAPMKDHHTLLEAVKLVRDKYSHLKCILVGDGPLLTQLKQEVKDLQLDGSVIFLGHKNHIGDLVNLFDIAILSSKHTEGCSNFILEAMYCSKPVVATDVGGTREVVIDGVTGLLVPKEDPQALSAAIFKLMKGEALRRTLGKAGRQRIEHEFMLEQMIKKTEEIYERTFRHRAQKDQRATAGLPDSFLINTETKEKYRRI